MGVHNVTEVLVANIMATRHSVQQALNLILDCDLEEDVTHKTMWSRAVNHSTSDEDD